MHESLTKLGVPSTLVMDAAVGYVLSGKVDCVLMGAEGVMESGGIVNKVCMTFHHCRSDSLHSVFLFQNVRRSVLTLWQCAPRN